MAVVTKKALAALVAEKTGASAKGATEAIDAVFAAIEESLKGGNDVVLGSVGRLKPGVRPARTARNPATGATINVPEKNVVKFKQSSSFEL